MTVRRRAFVRLASVLGVSAAIVAGCVTIPPTRPIAGGVTTARSLVSDDPMFKASQALVRFRTEMCDGVYTGSGFAIDKHRIITNRHVVGGASVIQAETWDGRSLTPTDTRITRDNDLAVVTVKEDLTHTIKLAPNNPPDDSTISVVGYPLGNALRVNEGTAIEILDGKRFGSDKVITMDVRVQHGNSGGPVVDDDGEVVGVVFKYMTAEDKRGLAIPVTTLKRVLATKALVANPGCEAYVATYGES